MKDLYFKLLVFVCGLAFFGGVMTSILKFLDFEISISIISLLIISVYPITLFQMLKHISLHPIIQNVTVIILIFSGLFLLKLLLQPLLLDIEGLSMALLFIFSIFAFYLPLGLNEEKTWRMLNYFMYFGYILLCIAYIQLFFYDSMHIAFVELPVIDSNSITKDYKREIEDLVLFRPNGLFANPITFGSLLLFFYSIELYKFIENKSIFNFATSVLYFIMIFALFSRANIIAVILITLITILLKYKIGKSLKIITSITILAIVAIWYFYDQSIALQFVIDRFTGVDDYAVSSNEAHIAGYLNALNVASENILLGISTDIKSALDIITDGTWFILLIRFGLPIFLLFLFLWLYVLKRIYQLNKFFPAFLFPFFFTASLISFSNSSLLEKKFFFIIWIIFGLGINLLILKRSESDEIT
jgi:hypothetical protein